MLPGMLRLPGSCAGSSKPSTEHEHSLCKRVGRYFSPCGNPSQKLVSRSAEARASGNRTPPPEATTFLTPACQA